MNEQILPAAEPEEKKKRVVILSSDGAEQRYLVPV